MTPFWKRTLQQLTLALITAIVLLFASSTTSRLHETQRKLHAGASLEALSADPAATYREIILETSPMAQLSSGFTGIAPSMHLIRMAAVRPLSNVDPIEHPARRRYGRVDFSFAMLIFLPIALIPLSFFIYRKCAARGDAEKLLSGEVRLTDFIIERVLLPLLASAGFVLLVTIACLYSAGVQLSSNEMLGRITIWVLMISLYLFSWILLFSFLLLRSRSFPTATLHYAGIFMLVAFLLPQLLQTFALTIERPKGRLPLLVERRKLTQQYKLDDLQAIDRYLERQGLKALGPGQPLPETQAAALLNLRIEEAIAPKLKEFEDTVRRLDEISIATAWLSPYLVAQYGVDDLAGTGLARYSGFRLAAINYHEQWRKYTLGFLARRQFMDFDALRNVPKFTFTGEDFDGILPLALIRCAYLALLCGLLGFAVQRQVRKIFPYRKRITR